MAWQFTQCSSGCALISASLTFNVQVFNCDDLLLNFVVANWTLVNRPHGGEPALLVHPRRRLDLSRLSGVGK